MKKTTETQNTEQIEYERNILSAIMNKPELLYEIGDFITPSYFYTPNNSWLYSKLVEIRNVFYGDKFDPKRKLKFDVASINVNLLANERSNKKLQDFLKQIYKINPAPKIFNQSLQKAKSYHTNVLLNKEITASQKSIKSNPYNSSVIGSLYEKTGDIILEFDKQNSFAHIATNTETYIDQYKQNDGNISGTPVISMPRLSQMINGFERKKLYLIAARAKTGKSTLLMNFATDFSRQGIPVLILDTELSDEEYSIRQVSHLSYYYDDNKRVPMGLPHRNIVNGSFRTNKDEEQRLKKIITLQKEIPFFHAAVSAAGQQTIKNIILQFYHQTAGIITEKQKKSGMPSCIIVYDWLKPSPELQGGNKTRTQEHQFVGDFASMLKKTAKELDIPVIAATQTGRSDKTDIKESDIRSMETEISQFDRLIHYCDAFFWQQKMPESTEKKIGTESGDQVLRLMVNRGGPDNKFGILLYHYGHFLTFREGDLLLDKLNAAKNN